ncbi:MAG: hypothetical protein PHG14_03720 [Desulfobacter postgatei]|uniref:hypothetical protein n=1 Tax=Desulfobacter postgatei TaxID=2293 RepID=UPI0023F43834|nr:hypothetical protein [Desulfobacter postgatei]MDD4272818.1 hypothetical protein [Desulfobacter postgatei]
MRYIEKIEVEEIVAKGRASSEQEITEMLDALEEKHPFNLLQYLESEVVKYASFKSARKKAISITNNLLFVLVRLLGDLYYSVQIKDA